MGRHHPDELSVEQWQDLLLDAGDITDYLGEFARTMAEALGDGTDGVWCAVTVLRRNKPATVTASDDRATVLDELQYSFRDGPCLTAIREHTAVHVDDTRTDERWPLYLRAAADQGVGTVLGVPFELEGEARAGLNLYAGRARALDAAAVEAAVREMGRASKSLRLALRLASHREVARDLTAAMRSRTAIDLAVGILMGRRRCTQHEAFAQLRATSNQHNIPVREIAAQLVAEVNGGPPETDFRI
ncbi:GAF and ANTAR domain-containing protein [Kocuria sp. M4R2S49]|uniref:GAF and ANTAR domain-containing protein n=1 Tax=Kocuria rhizosphaericola TaxID=3376284 RepID=UPI003790320A